MLAAAVWGHVAGLVVGVARRKAEVPVLWPSALALALCVTLQVVLGRRGLLADAAARRQPADADARQAMLRTAHQTNGALLLAASVVLTLRAFRHLTPSPPGPTPPARPEPAPRTMEVVA